MNFDVAVNWLLQNEGGYTPGLSHDPGGETNFGISKRSYPNLDIKSLTRDQAIAIYKTDFWNKVHADVMPDVLGFQALDFAVNSGIVVAIKKLQVAANVPADGVWGPMTQAAVAALPPAVLTFRFIAERLDYMRSLANWSSFASPWVGRIANDMRDAAQDLLMPT